MRAGEAPLEAEENGGVDPAAAMLKTGAPAQRPAKLDDAVQKQDADVHFCDPITPEPSSAEASHRAGTPSSCVVCSRCHI